VLTLAIFVNITGNKSEFLRECGGGASDGCGKQLNAERESRSLF
jgi:hypothetical protein